MTSNHDRSCEMGSTVGSTTAPVSDNRITGSRGAQATQPQAWYWSKERAESIAAVVKGFRLVAWAR